MGRKLSIESWRRSEGTEVGESNKDRQTGAEGDRDGQLASLHPVMGISSPLSYPVTYLPCQRTHYILSSVTWF